MVILNVNLLPQLLLQTDQLIQVIKMNYVESIDPKGTGIKPIY